METGNKTNDFQDEVNRRNFIYTATKALASGVLLFPALNSFSINESAEDTVTVGRIMDMFISEVPNAPFDKTVDTLKAGSRDTKVTGIVTSMFATIEVIQKAIASGANFIIGHEPTFYNHLDETSWLENDEVYRGKLNLLNQHKIAVWRNHDYIHSLVPDGVAQGVVEKLGWGNFFDSKTSVAVLPPASLKRIIQHAKEKLNISEVRYMGNLEATCKKILLMPGAAGGKSQITALGKEKPDVLICGEIQEWETAEYVRDARVQGHNLSLVVLGHIASEEPGSEFMAEWLKKKLPQVKVTHIPAKNSLLFV